MSHTSCFGKNGNTCFRNICPRNTCLRNSCFESYQLFGRNGSICSVNKSKRLFEKHLFWKHLFEKRMVEKHLFEKHPFGHTSCFGYTEETSVSYTKGNTCLRNI